MNSARLKLFEDVRAVVAGRIRDEGEIRELAQRVSEESTDLRRRIDRAVGYARDGLRLEACAEAEAEPTVFELSAAFDAPYVRQWRDWCVKHRLPHPEEVPGELVAEIEEAIAQTAPLRNKLATMRRLVLSDATAWQRLEILRVLVSRDPENPAWQEDRDAMEPVAAKELLERVELKVACGDLAEAEVCVRRLEDGKWAWGGIPKVSAQARGRYDRALAQRLAEEARSIVQRIDAEWAAESEQGVRSGLGAWSILAERMSGCGGVMPADAVARVQSAMEWMARREEAAAAIRDNRDRVAELARLADQEGATPIQLRAALRAAEQTSEGVPEDVRAAAERRLDAFDRRTVRLRAIAIAAVVLVVAGVSVYALVASHRATLDSAVAERLVALEEHIGSRRFRQAADLVDLAEADPGLKGHEGLAALRQRLSVAMDDEKRRADDWRRRFESAGKPGQVSFDDQKAELAFNEAKTDEEREKARKLLAAHADAKNRQFRAQLDDGGKAIASIRSRVDLADAEQLRQLEVNLQDARNRFGSLDDLSEQFIQLQRRIEARRGVIQNQQSASSQRDSILKLHLSLGDPAGFAAALRSFIDANPGAEVNKEFEKALESAASWRAVGAWSAMGERPTRELATASQERCNEISAELDRYLKANPEGPFGSDIEALRDLLVPAEEWRSALKDEFDNPEWKYSMIEDQRRRWYTTLPVGPTSSARIQVIKRVPPGEPPVLAFQAFPSAPVVVESPQARLAEALGERLRKLKNFPGQGLGQLAAGMQTIKDVAESDVDGIFKARTLIELMRAVAGKIDRTGLSQQLRKQADELSALEPERFDAWTDPTDARSRTRAGAAEAKVRELAKRLDPVKGYAESIAALCDRLAPYDSVGVIVTVDGTRRALPRDGLSLPAGTPVFAVDRAGPQVTMSRVAVVSSGDGIALEDAARAFPDGTILFGRRPARARQ